VVLPLALLVTACRDADDLARLAPPVLAPGSVGRPAGQNATTTNQTPLELPPRQPTDGFEFEPTGADGSGHMLFHVRILQNGNPYQVAESKLTPLFYVDGKSSTEYVSDEYFRSNPERTAFSIQPGDQFTLALPENTFLVRWQEERQEQLGQPARLREYVSERGDRLRYYLNDPYPLRYELLPHDSGGMAAIQLHPELAYLLANGRTDIARVAQLIYRVADPDIFQVEAIRRLATTLRPGEPTMIQIDRNQQHLDPVREVWPRAYRTEPVVEPERRHLTRAIFQVDANDKALAIEDAVGERTDIGELVDGRVFRLELNRDGSVRVFYKTGADDARGKRDPYQLRENERWSAIYQRLAPDSDPPVKWGAGQPNDLEPFPSARDPNYQTSDPLRAYDYLIPGRIIVYTFQPVRTLSSVKAELELHDVLRDLRDRYRVEIEQGLDYLERKQASYLERQRPK
jgi:hypothetical protein